MAVNIQGDNSAASPGLTGGDTDTGVRMGTNELSLVTGGTNRVNVDSSGNTTVASGNLTLSDGNLVVASGHGIDFSATTDGTTMSSELLDDYEEGTFTATFTPTFGGSITINTSFDTLGYTKIGRLVHIYGHIRINSASSPSGNLDIGGLPFTVISGVEAGRGHAVITLFDSSKSSGSRYQAVPAFFAEGGSAIRIESAQYDGGWTPAAGDEFMISNWYRTT